MRRTREGEPSGEPADDETHARAARQRPSTKLRTGLALPGRELRVEALFIRKSTVSAGEGVGCVDNPNRRWSVVDAADRGGRGFGCATDTLRHDGGDTGSAAAARAAVIVVPDDFATIQAALNVADPGDTVQVRQQLTPYLEKLAFPPSGDAVNGFITLEAFPGDDPVLDGTGVAGENMVLIDSPQLREADRLRDPQQPRRQRRLGRARPRRRARTSRSATTASTTSAAATPWASPSTAPTRRRSPT